MFLLIRSVGTWLKRVWSAILLSGRAIYQIARGRVDRQITLDQMLAVGPGSIVIAMITAAVIGMIFTIQVAREFLEIGSGDVVGGILAIALARELSPVLMAVVVAGRAGSAFSAEIGTMRVTEQVNALHLLRTDPVEYLVVPRVIACCVMVPALTVLGLIMGLLSGLVIANQFYGIDVPIFLDSINNFLSVWDIFSGPIKGGIFGALIAIVGCSWGLTTSGSAEAVGESTTAAVVTALLAIFVTDFLLSSVMFQGLGSGVSLLG